MSFFKSLFSSKKQTTPIRSLTHSNELQLNDIFTFGNSFSLPNVIRKQQLQVIAVNTIEFKHQSFAQIVGQGSGAQLVYLSFPSDTQQRIKISLLLSRANVEALFDMDDFAEIFEQPGHARLTVQATNHEYANMLAKEYIQQSFMETGYFHQQDYRGTKPAQYSEDSDAREFEFYSLEGAQGERSIELYIFENGDTDIYLSFFRPANEITELWLKEGE